jgi:hypothetical protein
VEIWGEDGLRGVEVLDIELNLNYKRKYREKCAKSKNENFEVHRAGNLTDG